VEKMNKGLMKKLLREATSPECTDARMIEVCGIVNVNKPWALKEIQKLQTRYNNTWSSHESTPDQIDVASVQNTQCHRLMGMLAGTNVIPRITVEQVRQKYTH
jgi:hypothetical protein